MKKQNVNMLSGPITKGLVSLIIPIMIMNCFQSLVSIIDMSILGRLVNDDAVGAVGTCGSLISLITGLIIGVSTGANVIVAKHIGSSNQERTDRAVGSALCFAVTAGVVLSIFGVVFAEKLLILINCDADLLEQASTYFRLYFAGVPFLFIYNFSASILRAIGDAKRPMYYMSACGILKILLNFLFITVFNATVEGVGFATVISWIISGSLCVRLLFNKDSKAHFKFKYFKFDFSELGRMLYIGIPFGLQSVMYSFANVMIVAEVNEIGKQATKGMAIANQFDGLMYQIAVASSYAISPYFSQNIAAKNVSRAKKALKSSIILTIVFGATLGGLMVLCSGPLCRIMTNDPVVVQYAQQKMLIASSLYFISGISECLGASLRALEKPIIPTLTTLVFMCLIRFPWVWFIYPLFPANLSLLYLIWPIGWTCAVITLTIVYKIFIKKVETKINKQLEEENSLLQTA